MNPPLMTYEEVAQYANCSKRTVEKLVAQKKLSKVVLANRTVRFRPSAVERCFEKLTEKGV